MKAQPTQRQVRDALRYWEPDDVPDELLDWVSDNVAAAIKYYWEEDPPVVWLEDKAGALVLVVAGPTKPMEDTDAIEDVYSIRCDLLNELTEYSSPYADIGGPRSDAQRDDMRERAAVLRALADAVSALAAKAEQDSESENTTH